MSRRSLSLFFFIISLSSIVSISMAESTPTQSSSVHIVYTEKPQDEEPEAYHIRTLASVLGSEDAAKEAFLYSYKNAASGFAAKLTPDQLCYHRVAVDPAAVFATNCIITTGCTPGGRKRDPPAACMTWKAAHVKTSV